MNAVPARTLDGLVDLLDVFRVTAREATNDRSEILIRNGFDRFEITWRSGGKAGFDDVDIEVGEGTSDAKLLAQRHAAARRLFAVSQGRIENADLFAHRPVSSGSGTTGFGFVGRAGLFR